VKRCPLRAAYVGATLSTLVACLLAQPAAAHVDVRPGLVTQGQVTELRVELPRLRPGPPPVGLTVTGAGIDVLATRLQGMKGPETVWTVRVRAEAPPGVVPVVLRATFADGRSVDVPNRLTVVPPAASGSFPRLTVLAGVLGAVGLAVAALLVARRRG
jgi:hypothetical protein